MGQVTYVKRTPGPVIPYYADTPFTNRHTHSPIGKPLNWDNLGPMTPEEGDQWDAAMQADATAFAEWLHRHVPSVYTRALAKALKEKQN